MCAVTMCATAQTTAKPQTQTTASEKHYTQYLTTEDFQKKVCNYKTSQNKWVYEGKRPCVIDFYATWCGPCRQLAPTMEKLAQKYEGKVDIYKVDVDKEKELAGLFGITSIPTLLFVPQDTVPMIAQGVLPEATLTEVIEKALLKK